MRETIMERIIGVFEERGATRYESGAADSVSQLEHALQCAALAEAAGADAHLITAALLHDLGHLMYSDAQEFEARNDAHEQRAASFLRGVFADGVLDPIRLHVAAKRYLCATEGNYYGGLSHASKLSLELQGGVYSPVQAARFIAQAGARDAVQLRRWDDQAKRKEARTPPLAYFVDILRASMPPAP